MDEEESGELNNRNHFNPSNGNAKNEDAEEEEEDDEDDTNLSQSDYVRSMPTNATTTRARGKKGKKNSDFLGGSMVIGSIDPALWKLETDRVAVKLAAFASAKNSSFLSTGSSEWADHVDAIREYALLHRKSGSSGHAEGVGNTINASSSRSSSSSSQYSKNSSKLNNTNTKQQMAIESLVSELTTMKSTLDTGLHKIRHLEQIVNRQGATAACALTYSSINDVRIWKYLFVFCICLLRFYFFTLRLCSFMYILIYYFSLFSFFVDNCTRTYCKSKSA